jgi:AcrR family transcriptional regulator
MPTGVALADARSQLLAAGARLASRDGPGGLSSRAVADEAGVAKGVLHRHFTDFDEFLVELVQRRITEIDAILGRVLDKVGEATITENLADAMTAIFAAPTLALVSIVLGRDEVRIRLRPDSPSGLPLLTQASMGIARYLAAEREDGRITRSADVDKTAMTIVGTCHLLFTGELGGLPDLSAVREIIESIVVGIEAAPAG